MDTSGRRNLLLLLLGIDSGREGLGGLTRLQKLLFLIEREGQLEPSQQTYPFEPYKAGPYSPQLYDDLEFLENLGYVDSEVTAESSEPEAAEVDLLSFGHLMGDNGGPDDDGPASADAFEEKRFWLTDKGRQRVKSLLQSGRHEPTVNTVRRIKSKYGKYSLNDLLYYVYTKYPDMTTESEIRDKVLRRGQRR